MPVQDRTLEFRTCVDSIRNRSANPPKPKRQLAGPSGGSKSEFARIAGAIGRDIAGTTVKLEKLAQLAKRKTLFDDKPVEISVRPPLKIQQPLHPNSTRQLRGHLISSPRSPTDMKHDTRQELTYVIKQEIASINKQIATLQAYVKQQNASKSGGQREVEEHNNNVVMLLQSKLANTSMSFKDVLEIRTQNMKESKDRTDQFVYSAGQAAANAPPPASSLLFADPADSRSKAKVKGKARAAVQDSDLLALDIDRAEAGEMPNGGGDGYMQMQLVERQDNYLQERSTAIESIESTIAELGQIFTQLAQMVAEQRETVQRIDADTVDIANNVAGAQRELLKYYSSISSNRWLMLKVFGVLIVFSTEDLKDWSDHEEKSNEYYRRGFEARGRALMLSAKLWLQHPPKAEACDIEAKESPEAAFGFKLSEWTVLEGWHIMT
ncbi:cis-Golgi t-SNARE syntaxin [Ceratobasidium sp. 370]|nr:cis-Golgi t-SNARE syntaxin [Ceratobasidium sp. 370]